MPKLTIDDREIEVPAGTKVIEAAEQLGIIIPRFCFHPALGAVGACRVCAVSFKDGPVKGIQMSCMINAQDEMVVSTVDDEAMDFRRHVIEWLMLNHPHDCPVCDEGGHCLLQDLTVSGGHGMRRYKGLKRTHHDQYLGPLIQHEMNRCIQCYRCSRYYQEFAGSKDLGAMGIGSRIYFGRSKPGILESPFAGNLIDLCPTGVYTDKPSRFIGRRWDFQRSPTVCLHCSLGCNLVVSARYRSVVRHEARPNPDVNGYFICDRGRYGYAYNGSAQRPYQALALGEFQEMDAAVKAAKYGLEAVIRTHGPRSVAAVGSVRSNLETLATLDLLCCENQWAGPFFIHEARKAKNLQTVMTSLEEDLAVSLGAVSVAEFILVIGADPINEAPMLALSLRQAQRQGGRIVVVDPRPIEMPLDYDHLPVPLAAMASVLRYFIAAAGETLDMASVSSQPSTPFLGDDALADRLEALTATLCRCRRAVIVCGTDITTAQEIGLAAELARTMRCAGTEAKLFFPLMGSNAFAAGRMTKDVDGIDGLLDSIEGGRVKALVVAENDLWRNYTNQSRLIRALQQLESLILLDYVASPLVDKADIFMPTQTLYESGGHWINHEARLQLATPVLKGGVAIEALGNGSHPPRVFENTIPAATPEPAWRLLSALMSGVDGADAVRRGDLYTTAMERASALMGELQDGKRVALIRGEGADEQAAPIQEVKAVEVATDFGEVPAAAISLLLVDWTFGTEGLASTAPALADVTPSPMARVHPETAAALGVGENEQLVITIGDGELFLPWQADKRMARHLIVVPRHHTLAWQGLGGTRVLLAAEQIKGKR